MSHVHSPQMTSSSSRHHQQRGMPGTSLPPRTNSPPNTLPPHGGGTNGHQSSAGARLSLTSVAGSQQHALPPASHSANPPPPPLTIGNTAPVQGPSVLQILTQGQERNHAADQAAHHPRIESLIKLAKESELTWLQIGTTAESLGDGDRAIASYESALRHNAYSIQALSQIATICRAKEDFKKAAEYFGRVVGISPDNGDVWGALGHCYLMLDDLKKAYSSYQQALYYMPNPNEPKLWYGIGILYDRYGSLEHAEEAFSSVIRMDPTFEKANEIFFRLGIIYKQQRKSQQSLECFRYILQNPPRPLTEIDIWFQIGHVYEQQKDFNAAKESYERVLSENPAHAKVLQQLGGLYHRSRAPFYNPDISVQILTKSLESDPNDPFSWYLLGRAYMTTQNFGKAYEAYQQAVYRDGKNPAFWCSIGVLYYNINQYHDALDAYSRAIRIHPYLAEVWFNLGALYESCNDQMTDAIDAYQRTLQLEPSNTIVSARLREIREHQTTGAALSPPPQPKDISPSSLSWSHASSTSATPNHLTQGGSLGADLSPALGRVPTANGAPQSPPNGHRFEGPPPTGRPQSTDPYRNGGDGRRRSGQGSHHSPSNSVDQSPRASAHRLSGPSSAHLPQIKGLQEHRGSPTIPGASEINRRNSPLSPRARHSELEHSPYPPPPGGYPSSSALPPFSRNGPPGPDEMEWERTNGRNGSGSSGNGRGSAQSHRRSPPDSSQSRDGFAYPPSRDGNPPPNPYDRRVPSPGVGRLALPDDRDYRNGSHTPSGPGYPHPQTFHYGSFPGAQAIPAPAPRKHDTREPGEEDGRRSRGPPASSRSDESPRPQTQETTSSNGSKKSKAGAGGAKKEPEVKRESGTPGAAAPPKGGRKGKDSDGGAAPKKERKPAGAGSGASGAKRARSTGASSSKSGPANAVSSEHRLSLESADRASPSSTGSSPPPPAPVSIPASRMPSRIVDESYDDEYDEGVDALMGLATSGASSHSQSPPHHQPTSDAPPPLPALPTVSEGTSTPTVGSDVDMPSSNPRKRSIGELVSAAEEEVATSKRAKATSESPQPPPPEEVAPAPAASVEENAPVPETKAEVKMDVEEVAAPSSPTPPSKVVDTAPEVGASVAEAPTTVEDKVVEEGQVVA